MFERRLVAPLIAIGAGVFLVMATGAFAETSDTPAPPDTGPDTAALALREEIRDRASKIAELEKEIDEAQKDLDRVGEERQTLERAVSTIDISRRKITANISLTEEKIKAAEITIGDISLSIDDKERRITLNEGAIAESLRTMNEADHESSLEVMLGASNFADVWDVAERALSLQVALREDLRRLKALRDELGTSKNNAQATKDRLAGLHRELGGEKQALDVTRLEKQNLLSVTKNEESAYQQLLQDKLEAREQFEKELAQLEAELKFTFDSGAIPSAGSGVLSWPFDNAYMANCATYTKALGNSTCITQYFGDTQFSKLGSYNGKGHNGVDFRAPIGTRITAAASGRIAAIGNTDAVRGCYSYGRWILIDHGNGLSSLYGHLSGFNVKAGDIVVRGDLIGFSGNTGYSTGPHVHFTVYATSGVEVRQLGGGTPCSKATMPIAATQAYLNPMAYL